MQLLVMVGYPFQQPFTVSAEIGLLFFLSLQLQAVKGRLLSFSLFLTLLDFYRPGERKYFCEITDICRVENVTQFN